MKKNLIDFLKGYSTWLHKSIDEGCNVKGYHMWTFIDNWSWSNAYKNRYGFIQLDLKTQERIPKKSAYWIKEVAKSNGF
ncbi:family 1 glycosylhydrolase [Clostridium psychrophilum]|nr:family 1 glycosylhydrolase [Clostridium psychrophilum]